MGWLILLALGVVGYEVLKTPETPQSKPSGSPTGTWSVKRDVSTVAFTLFNAGDFVTVVMVESKTNKEMPAVLSVASNMGDPSGKAGLDCVYDQSKLSSLVGKALPLPLSGVADGAHFVVFPKDVLAVVGKPLDTSSPSDTTKSSAGGYSVVHGVGAVVAPEPGGLSIVVLQGADKTMYAVPLTSEGVYEKTLVDIGIKKFESLVHKATGSTDLPVPPGTHIGPPSDLPDGTKFDLKYSMFPLGDVVFAITAEQMKSDIAGEAVVTAREATSYRNFGEKPWGGKNEQPWGGKH